MSHNSFNSRMTGLEGLTAWETRVLEAASDPRRQEWVLARIVMFDVEEVVVPLLIPLYQRVHRRGPHPRFVGRALAEQYARKELSRTPGRKALIEYRLLAYLDGMAWFEYPPDKRAPVWRGPTGEALHGNVLHRIHENASIIVLYNGGVALQEVLGDLRRSFWTGEAQTEDSLLRDRLEARIRDLRHVHGPHIVVPRTVYRARVLAR